MEKTYSLMGGSEFINSIRSTGYKNTGYALGEIIDNSIQAGATDIHVVVEIRHEIVTARSRENIVRISVVDNGCGMDPELLRSALLFGEGTNFNKKRSLGKFGVGLPQASISQGKVLKVWSWQNGVSSAYYTGFDISNKEWREGGARIPEPQSEMVPAPFCNYIDTESKSGTVVSWSGLDRINWRSSRSLFENVEFLVGRMYRYWIADNKVNIQYHVVNSDSGQEQGNPKIFRAVDPLYLMEKTSVVDENPPVNPMFELVGEVSKTIHYGDIESKVIIKSSVARAEIRKLVNKTDQAGAKEYGKHAAKNTGVSIVREGRELELVSDWAATISSTKDTRNRWWGLEIQFSSELDELFGVTNDKQHANNLLNCWGKTIDDFRLEGESKEEARARLKLEDSATLIMIELSETIADMIKDAYNLIPSGDGRKSGKEKEKTSDVEKKATENTELMKQRGQEGCSDYDEFEMSLESKKKELVDTYRSYGVSQEEIEQIVDGYITNHYKYNFVRANLPNEDAFFVPRFTAGAIVIMLNTAHPMYQQLFGIFEFMDEQRRTPGDDIDAETYALMEGVYDSIKMLLASWARLEDVAIKNNKRSPISNRNEWGKMVKNLNGDEVYENDDE